MSPAQKKRRAAAGWCVANGIEPGATIEVMIFGAWAAVRVTAIGESAILARRKGCGEFDHFEPTKLRLIAKGDDR